MSVSYPSLKSVDVSDSSLTKETAPPPLPAALAMELCAFAEELAEAARKQILPYWRKPIEVESKIEEHRAVAESPVTVADRNAEKAMRTLIEARYPSHGIFGEELGSVRVDAEFVWVLDPIDGTKSFITGKPLFGTLIGLCHHGVPTIGVIDQCVLKERWVGIRGVKTTLNGEIVKAVGKDTLSEAMLYATTPHMFAEGFESERFGSLRDMVKRPLYGCDCYAYALVASGFGADLVVEADLGLYDYAALVPVVTGGGGCMTDWNGDELTIPHHEASKGRVVAAANGALHSAAIEVLRAA
jgi:inositol-phosphate phosphatase/L-galactose 1-phosphate phosphatase/histidinol-phosphatase